MVHPDRTSPEPPASAGACGDSRPNRDFRPFPVAPARTRLAGYGQAKEPTMQARGATAHAVLDSGPSVLRGEGSPDRPPGAANATTATVPH